MTVATDIDVRLSDTVSPLRHIQLDYRGRDHQRGAIGACGVAGVAVWSPKNCVVCGACAAAMIPLASPVATKERRRSKPSVDCAGTPQVFLHERDLLIMLAGSKLRFSYVRPLPSGRFYLVSTLECSRMRKQFPLTDFTSDVSVSLSRYRHLSLAGKK